MLENFIFSCNAIVPIFAMIVVGYFLKQKNYIDDATVKKLNTIVFKFTLPAMLFVDVATSDIRSNFDLGFLVWIICFTFATFVVSWIIAEIFIKDKASIGAFVQGSFRGNYTILGLSVISSVLGPLDTGKGVLVTTFIVPMYNILAVIVLSLRNGGEKTETSAIKNAFKHIVTNPLIIGIFLGFPFSLFSIEIPEMVLGSIDNLGSITMPVALICIGGNIDFKSSFKNIKPALLASAIKQILIPVTGVLIAVYGLNMRGEELVVTFIMASTPTAVSSYIMAYNMESDPDLASNIILITTVMSLFTFTLGIYLLKTFNLF